MSIGQLDTHKIQSSLQFWKELYMFRAFMSPSSGAFYISGAVYRVLISILYVVNTFVVSWRTEILTPG
jgi:hypothetical protein